MKEFAAGQAQVLATMSRQQAQIGELTGGMGNVAFRVHQLEQQVAAMNATIGNLTTRLEESEAALGVLVGRGFLQEETNSELRRRLALVEDWAEGAWVDGAPEHSDPAETGAEQTREEWHAELNSQYERDTR